jgi:outer membrane usher protein
MSADRDILLAVRELRAMGAAGATGRIVDFDGEAHLSLKSIAGAKFTFDEKTLTLDLQLPPDMLPGQRLDVGAKLPPMPVQRREPGGFFNYSIGYSHVQDAADSLNLTTETGINIGDFLLLDNHTVNTQNPGQRSVRLQTQLIDDQPDELRRWVIGDAFASSGNLGSSLNLGGISVSKLYQINPYFIKTPLAAFAGAVSLPSTVDVYMNGARVLSQTVAPGNFSLQNLTPANTIGLRNIDIVIRDAFGTEQHIGFPYFFSDQLLARGLQEYSYNLGFIRENYGVRSDDYGPVAFSAFHRYGVTDFLTVGGGIDATRNHVNLDPRFTLNTVKAGVVSADVAYSHDDLGEGSGQSGRAASVSHTYIQGPFSSQLLVQRYSENYSVLGFTPNGQPKLQSSVNLNYGNRDLGTYSLGYAVGTVYGGLNDQHTTTLGYTRTVFGDVSLVANLSRVLQGTSGYTVFVGLSLIGKDGQLASASRQRSYTGDVDTQLQVAKTPPLGEGLGYRFIADRSVTSGVASDSVSPFVQYNARDAILMAQGTNFLSGSGANFYQLTVAGAVTYAGGSAYLSRPITDSFGVVKIDPPLAGVRVLKGNATIGTTDASGTVFVPILGSYQVNEVGIQPKDIPLDYAVAQSTQKIRPPFRSGAVATFSVKRVRAVTGSLKLHADGIVAPLENYDVTLAHGAESAPMSTIRNGDFYVENLEPGSYTAHLKVGTKTCRLELAVPDTEEIVVELGDVFCEPVN